MKKSKIVFITIALMLIAYVVGVKIGRNQAIHNARLVEDNGETYVIGAADVMFSAVALIAS